MNFYNPYYMVPMTNMVRPSLFNSLRGSFSFGNLLNGTQRTLNLINQAIPIVKQISPVVRNARTMFRVMNEFKKTDAPRQRTNNAYNHSVNNINNTYKDQSEITDEYGPKFFV